jgi:hypothetical protein
MAGKGKIAGCPAETRLSLPPVLERYQSFPGPSVNGGDLTQAATSGTRTSSPF